ncbi:Bro-N domain-containing protein [Mannheimia sp. HC-2023]|uniref:BRO-N domain-containing protein n=1 Tax=Mannheimia indoligenes TaxID=3103145 RepID=UPI002FE587FD
MTTLTFQNTTLSVIDQNNQKWIPALEVGRALGYADPSANISKLYERNKDEFTPSMTAIIDMDTASGMQKVRIFSLRGCWLLGMRSHTKVAKDFRKWVLDILDREVSQNSQQIAPLSLPEKPRKIQGTTRAPEGEYLYTREFSAIEIDHLAKLWDIAEEQHKFIESLTSLFEVMQSEQWFKQHSRALSCFNHHNYSYHILSEMCEDVEEWTGIMPSIRAVKMKGKYYSRF